MQTSFHNRVSVHVPQRLHFSGSASLRSRVPLVVAATKNSAKSTKCKVQYATIHVNQLNGIHMLTIQPHWECFMAQKYKTQYFSAEMCDEKNNFNAKKNWRKEQTEAISFR